MMVTFDEAQRILAAAVTPLGEEAVVLAEAAGRVLARDVVARSSSPRQAVSAMDGYAVVDAATAPGQRLDVIGESRAGAGFAGIVAPGEAVRIFTGAPIPAGADRVIVQENIERDGSGIIIAREYGPGWHIRQAGSDFAAGDVLLAAGQRLTARAMVAAAAADRAELRVARQPRIAIIATGDELAPPGTAHARPDAIPESVSFGITAQVAAGGGSVACQKRGVDDLAGLIAMAGAALDAGDLTIVTGGASVGDRDFAKPMFAEHGVELLFEKVAIKPGKPVWLGRAGEKWVLGLPGNPTSAMVTARLFLMPLLAGLQGQRAPQPLDWRHLPLAALLPATGDRETFVRARWQVDGLVPVSNQDSGSQAALVAADWLIRCPAGQSALEPGAGVTALPF